MRLLVSLLFAGSLLAQDQQQKPADPPVSLRELSLSLERLTTRLRPAVVQVFTTAYTPLGDDTADASGTTTSLFTKQRGTGSGVIVTADGYIVTNNHVVDNGRKIQVRVAPAPDPTHRSILPPAGKTYAAKVVGVDRESDVAILKIDARNLAHAALGDSDALRQGQLVMAFGNPLGLEGSVSMGVVSSNARQIRPDDSMIYIQTDAPINPGNSGGPLIDSEGRVVGINTFILSQSGGSEGIGFAIPSNIVKSIYQQIRKDGHVHRGQIGIQAQTITTDLAAGLHLPHDRGVIVSDVLPDGPASSAGVKIGDIVLTVNGRRMENARQLEVDVYRHWLDEKVTLQLERDGKTITAEVPVVERNDDPMRFSDLVDPSKALVPKLGILAIEITEKMASMLSQLRFEHGLVVAARSSEAAASGLKPGDVIYSANRTPAVSVKALIATLDALPAGEPVVLQIQRGDRVMYLTLDLE